MNKEIEEILKILKKCKFGACITKHNSRVLLDYITDLQEELEEEKRIEEKSLETIFNLQEENEKLNIILQGLANQKYEEKCKNAKIVHIEYVTKEKLQERINKAIEYFDRRDIDWGSEEHDHLLNILKGEE